MGDLYMWGRGDSGQLGMNDNRAKWKPTLLREFVIVHPGEWIYKFCALWTWVWTNAGMAGCCAHGRSALIILLYNCRHAALLIIGMAAALTQCPPHAVAHVQTRRCGAISAACRTCGGWRQWGQAQAAP